MARLKSFVSYKARSAFNKGTGKREAIDTLRDTCVCVCVCVCVEGGVAAQRPTQESSVLVLTHVVKAGD